MNNFCKNCGAKISADSKFCASCGAPIDVEISQQTMQNFQTEDSGVAEIFFKREGRLNRLRYFKRNLALIGILFLILIVIGVIFADDAGNVSPTADYLISLAMILFLIPLFCLDVRRLHDLNKNETLAYVSFALGLFSNLTINIESLEQSLVFAKIILLSALAQGLISIYLLFFVGTKGANQYGADPLESYHR